MRIRRSRGGVIGSRVTEAGPVDARSLRTPVWTRRSRGRDEDSRGSGCPRTIWAWRTAAKYVLIVAGAIPSRASDVTKLVSETGNGGVTPNT